MASKESDKLQLNLSNNGDLNEKGETQLHTASIEGDLEKVAFFRLEGGSDDRISRYISIEKFEFQNF